MEESSGSKEKTQPTEVEKSDNQKVDTKKTVKDEVKQEKVVEDKSQILSSALKKGDYVTVQKLANQGFAPSYVPLAK